MSVFPLYTPASRWRPFVLREDGEVLCVRPDPSARKWAFLFGVGGTVIVGWLILTMIFAGYVGEERPRFPPAVAVGAYCAAIAIAVGVFWNLPVGRSADVVFDRKAGRFRGRCWTRAGWRRDFEGPLACIASLQICCHEIDVEEGDNYQTYELNVVLANPPGERFGLGSHADPVEVQRDAARLAAFLNCGVLMDCPSLRPFPRLPETMRHRKGKRS